MRTALILILMLCLRTSVAFAQDQAPVDDETPTAEAPEAAAPIEEAPKPPADTTARVSPRKPLLLAENQGRARTNRIGALVLGGWALANVSWAFVGLLRQPEEREQSFHLTNAAIDLVIAGVGVTTYFSNLENDDWPDFSTVQTLNASHSTEKLYLLSSGLDLAYVATGAFLTAKGNLDRKEGIVGTGRALMLQGAVLFAFDAAMFTFHWLRRTAFIQEFSK